MGARRDKDGMTLKQKKLAKEYIKSGNGSDAARKAGYPARSAGTVACEILKKPHVIEFMEKFGQNHDALKDFTDEHILSALVEQIISCQGESAKIRAIELLGKSRGLFKDVRINETRPSSESIIARAHAELGPEMAKLLEQRLSQTVDKMIERQDNMTIDAE